MNCGLLRLLLQLLISHAHTHTHTHTQTPVRNLFPHTSGCRTTNWLQGCRMQFLLVSEIFDNFFECSSGLLVPPTICPWRICLHWQNNAKWHVSSSKKFSWLSYLSVVFMIPFVLFLNFRCDFTLQFLEDFWNLNLDQILEKKAKS